MTINGCQHHELSEVTKKGVARWFEKATFSLRPTGSFGFKTQSPVEWVRVSGHDRARQMEGPFSALDSFNLNICASKAFPLKMQDPEKSRMYKAKHPPPPF